MSDTIDKNTFTDIYAKAPAWDIDGPQPAFRDLKLAGTLLDSGCGSGEHALYFAKQGATVTGIDFVEAAIAQARAKSRDRGVAAEFRTMDALTLQSWDARFDNAIDSGVMHVFSDADRATYLAGLAHVVRPGGRLYLLCFSDRTPGTEGPRRVTQAELTGALARDWHLESLTPARFAVRPEALRERFAGEAPHAWFAVARRP